MAKTKLKKSTLKKVKSTGKKPPKKAAPPKTSVKKKVTTKALPKKAGLVNKIKKTLKKALQKSGAPEKIIESKKELKNKNSIKASAVKASSAKALPKMPKTEPPSKTTPAQKRPPLGPIEPGRLGQKRHCLKCGIKFYDFERLPITCPKCFSEFDPEDFEPKISLKSDSKKSRPVAKEEEAETEIVVSDSGEDFESLEDLSDDDSAVVGIETGKDSDESFD